MTKTERRGPREGGVFILATRNPHKLRELAEILPGIGLRPLAPGVELPPEAGESFAANALIKARAARLATGRAALGEDSGIEVAALGNRPGVNSARYAGERASDEENLEKLLSEVAAAGVPRRATYVCAIALVEEAGEEHTFEGRCEGHLTLDPRGTGGFGYDPAFVPDDTGPRDRRTMAELGSEEKHAVSHRGRAARLLVAHLGAASPETAR